MSFKIEMWPTEAERVITQHFGANPDYYAQFDLPGHDGIDLRAPHGSRVFSVAPGEVIRVHRNPNDHNYGIHVYIEHADGFITGYAHLSEARVDLHDEVKAGTVLGLADSTGNSFGTHLHFVLKRAGRTFGNWPYNLHDPTPYLLPMLGWKAPAGETLRGWMQRSSLFIYDDLAQVAPDGGNLWFKPDEQSYFVPGGTIVRYLGEESDYFVLVDVSRASVGLEAEDEASAPDSMDVPQPTVSSLDGWVKQSTVFVFGSRAVVRRHGTHLRLGPEGGSPSIGLVRSSSTLTLLDQEEAEFLYVRARREDMLGPINLPLPELENVGGEDEVARAAVGWIAVADVNLTNGRRGEIVPPFGADMHAAPSADAPVIGVAKGRADVTQAGMIRDDFMPVAILERDLVRVVEAEGVQVETPDPLPAESEEETGSSPNATTPGWVFTADLASICHDEATVGLFGVVLRSSPKRDAEPLGFVPANATVIVTAMAQGEFTPVRVDEEVLVPYDETDAEEPVLLGPARFGLHASADPNITESEIALFDLVKPRLIKVLSFHEPDAVRRLATQHPKAHWVVRAFLDFGGRAITPAQFVEYTLSDTQRTLRAIGDKPLVVELHNEPNLTMEGLGSAWRDGAEFADWWLEVLAAYRRELPDVKFIYPGLSPGGSMVIRQDHVQFIEASRPAVEAADGLGVHLYWTHYYSPDQALQTLDDLSVRFRNSQLWLTEVGNGSSQVTPDQKGREYIAFWESLRLRPMVQGVTYWVASGSNPDFAPYVWLGTPIGQIASFR